MQGIRPTASHSALDVAPPSSSGLTPALDAAVRHGDVERMRDLLKQGADPESVEPGNTGISAQTDELLMAARKINHLLPRGKETGSESRFETALRDYDLPRARKILANALAKYRTNLNAADTAVTLWKKAAKKGLHPILDTMLMLGNDKLNRYRSGGGGQDSETIMDALLTRKGLNSVLHYPLEKAGVRHQALRDYLKQFPYYSPKPERQAVAKLNGRVDFKDNQKQKIACRHLAFAWLTKVRHANGKPDYDMLKDAGRIQATIPSYKIDAEYDAFLANAQEVHMVVNKEWGRFAADQFKEIEDRMEKGNPPVKRMLVESGTHAMAVEFKIKDKAGKKSYVQNFYDPNLTNVHKRVGFDGVHCAEAHSLAQLFHGLSTYHRYYGETETVSMAYVVSDDGNTAPAAGNPGRRLSSSLDGIDIDASVLFHLLQSGFDGELNDIANRLLDKVRQYPDQTFALLAAKNVEKTSGLHMALQEGHTNAVKVFTDIVLQSGLDAEQQVELLAARRSDEASGLFMALQHDHAHAIRTFAESVIQSRLGDEQKVELLAAKNVNKTPGLSMALQKNNANAVRAFAESVSRSLLDDKQKVGLLAARRPDGFPGLFMALQNDCAHAVLAFAESVIQSQLCNEQKLHLLAAKNADEIPALFMALQKNNANAVRAFVESVSRSQLGDGQKVELLAAKSKKGRPGILMAESGRRHCDSAATAFREAIKQWLTAEQQALLEAEIYGNKRRRITSP